MEDVSRPRSHRRVSPLSRPKITPRGTLQRDGILAKTSSTVRDIPSKSMFSRPSISNKLARSRPISTQPVLAKRLSSRKSILAATERYSNVSLLRREKSGVGIRPSVTRTMSSTPTFPTSSSEKYQGTLMSRTGSGRISLSRPGSGRRSVAANTAVRDSTGRLNMRQYPNSFPHNETMPSARVVRHTRHVSVPDPLASDSSEAGFLHRLKEYASLGHRHIRSHTEAGSPAPPGNASESQTDKLVAQASAIASSTYGVKDIVGTVSRSRSRPRATSKKRTSSVSSSRHKRSAASNPHVRYPAGFDDPFSSQSVSGKISLRRPPSTRRSHSRSLSSAAFAHEDLYTNIHSSVGGASSSSHARSSASRGLDSASQRSVRSIVGTRRSSGTRRPTRTSNSSSRPPVRRNSTTSSRGSGSVARKSVKDKTRLLKKTSKRGIKSTVRHDQDRFDDLTADNHHIHRCSALDPITSTSSIKPTATATPISHKRIPSSRRQSLSSTRRPSVTRDRTSIADEILSKYRNSATSQSQSKVSHASFHTNDELDSLASRIGTLSFDGNKNLGTDEAAHFSSLGTGHSSSRSHFRLSMPQSSNKALLGLESMHSRLGDIGSTSQIIQPSVISSHTAQSRQRTRPDLRLYGLDDSHTRADARGRSHSDTDALQQSPSKSHVPVAGGKLETRGRSRSDVPAKPSISGEFHGDRLSGAPRCNLGGSGSSDYSDRKTPDADSATTVSRPSHSAALSKHDIGVDFQKNEEPHTQGGDSHVQYLETSDRSRVDGEALSTSFPSSTDNVADNPPSSPTHGSRTTEELEACLPPPPYTTSSFSAANSPSGLSSARSRTQFRQEIGLRNLGNTCFMNSVLQCLSSTYRLVHYFETGTYKGDKHKPSKSHHLLGHFANLVKSFVSDRNGSTYSPNKLKAAVGRLAPRFLGYDQQDASEFLKVFLDHLHDDLNRVREKPPYVSIEDKNGDSDERRSQRWWANYVSRECSFVSELFCGQLRSEVTCLTCQRRSVVFDPFWEISVPIPKTGRLVNLGECLEAFSAVETLSGNDAYYCSKCKTHQSVRKQISVYRFPPVLVVTIKRFESSNYGMRRRKLTTAVEFPVEEVDFSPFSAVTPPSSSLVYDLYGVVNHSGTLSGGHYTADIKLSSTLWRHFSDSHMSASSAQRLSSTNAYVLFYERRPS